VKIYAYQPICVPPDHATRVQILVRYVCNLRAHPPGMGVVVVAYVACCPLLPPRPACRRCHDRPNITGDKEARDMDI